MRKYEYEKGSKPYDRPVPKRRNPESDVHAEAERGSRLFRGAQEVQAGSSRRPHVSYLSRIFPSSAPAKNKGDQRIESSLNQQSRNFQHDFIAGEPVQATEPSATNPSEPGQSDSIAALESARALIAASGPEVPISPLKQWKANNSTSGDRANNQEQVPPFIHQGQPVAPSLPSLLRGRYGPHQGALPLEHPTHTADSSSEGAQPFNAQEQSSHMDNMDRPITLRDLAYFIKAIQDTIREMSSDFIEGLAEMNRSKDNFEESERE